MDVDNAIVTGIIILSILLIYEYTPNNTETDTEIESFAEIDIVDSERSAIVSYKDWLKSNQDTLVPGGTHYTNYINLFHRIPEKSEAAKLRRDPPPKKAKSLDGSISFLEAQNKIVDDHFKRNANKIGFISSDDSLDRYVSNNYVDSQIVPVDPRAVHKKPKRKLPNPVKLV